MLAHDYNIIIDRDGGVPLHGIEVVDGFNSTDKSFLSMLITTVQLSGAEAYEAHIENSYLSCKHRHQFSEKILKISFRPITGTWVIGLQ